MSSFPPEADPPPEATDADYFRCAADACHKRAFDTSAVQKRADWLALHVAFLRLASAPEPAIGFGDERVLTVRDLLDLAASLGHESIKRNGVVGDALAVVSRLILTQLQQFAHDERRDRSPALPPCGRCGLRAHDTEDCDTIIADAQEEPRPCVCGHAWSSHDADGCIWRRGVPVSCPCRRQNHAPVKSAPPVPDAPPADGPTDPPTLWVCVDASGRAEIRAHHSDAADGERLVPYVPRAATIALIAALGEARDRATELRHQHEETIGYRQHAEQERDEYRVRADSMQSTIARMWIFDGCLLDEDPPAGSNRKCPDDDPPKCAGCRATDAEKALVEAQHLISALRDERDAALSVRTTAEENLLAQDRYVRDLKTALRSLVEAVPGGLAVPYDTYTDMKVKSAILAANAILANDPQADAAGRTR